MVHLPITNRTMTLKQFTEWIQKHDTNKDGLISKKELEQALRELGLRFIGWKVWRAMVHADLNRDNVIHGEKEIEELAKYAKKRWGISIDIP